jgi:hypothetical protein
VGLPLLCTSVDGFEGWILLLICQLMLSRGGHPLLCELMFPRVGSPLALLCQFMLSKDVPPLLCSSVDDFKGRALF